jgi:hypothetical protein
MERHENPDELERAMDVARARAASAPHGIGAAYVRDRSDPELSSWYGEVAVDDGTGVQLAVLVGITAAGGGRPFMTVDGDKVAGLIEELAGEFGPEQRLKDLVFATTSGPGILLDRWFPDANESVRV